MAAQNEQQTETVEPSTPKRHRRWIIPTVVGVVTLLVGFALGQGEDLSDEVAELESQLEQRDTELDDFRSQADSQNAELRDQKAELDERETDLQAQGAELTERSAELDEREADLEQTELEIAEGTIPGTGVFLVGEDIEPGTYRNEGTSGCYWARLSGTSGDFDDLIANDNPRGPTVVTIADSDVAFETTRCADWVKQD